MNATIRPATMADGPAIFALLARSELPIDGLPDHLHTALVAQVDDRIVGCAALEIYADGALLRSVAVDAAMRKHGIGRALTQAAIAAAEQRGMPMICLLTTTAGQFFQRLGFVEVSRADVPIGVLQSAEFQYACPASASVMRRVLVP